MSQAKKPEGHAGEPASPEAAPGGVPRRDFFREGLRNILRPLARIVEERVDSLRLPPGMLSGSHEDSPPAFGPACGPEPAIEGRLLRPPGALREDLFVDRCIRSGQCVAACPVQAIRPFQTEDAGLNGLPYIDPAVQACVVCDGLHCMKACPSGALSLVPRHSIAMGLAELRPDICVRTSGEECQICVEKCPIGRSAIEIPYYGARVEVKGDGCVGCGVCEQHCPTTPKAIVVRRR